MDGIFIHGKAEVDLSSSVVPVVDAVVIDDMPDAGVGVANPSTWQPMQMRG